jgi:hypothetical protein
VISRRTDTDPHVNNNNNNNNNDNNNNNNTVELHLSGLIGTAGHLDVQKIRVIGFFFENRLHCQYEVEKSSTNSYFRLRVCSLTNKTLFQ